MIVLALVGILAAVATPAFRSIMQSTRTSTQTDDLVSTLQIARSTALTQKTTVFVSAIGDNWANGWRIWIDSNNSGGFNDGEQLHEFESLTGNSTLSAGPVTQLSFSNEGFLRSPATAVSFTLRMADCAGGSDSNRTITLSLNGRVSVKTLACS